MVNVATADTYTHTSRGTVFLVAALFALLFVSCTSEKPDKDADAKVAEAPIVVVFNGCGIAGAARQISDVLRNDGWDIGSGYGENADSFEYPDTFVVDYVGDRETAQRIADKLGTFMIQQISHDPDRFGTVGVYVGADYRARIAHANEG